MRSTHFGNENSDQNATRLSKDDIDWDIKQRRPIPVGYHLFLRCDTTAPGTLPDFRLIFSKVMYGIWILKIIHLQDALILKGDSAVAKDS
ncbi:hypothetical protein MFRU_007g03680 [Monilinia fructicola]|nr:hypothetical protein MFRU_007g03680 [Monilinia fructicola]